MVFGGSMKERDFTRDPIVAKRIRFVFPLMFAQVSPAALRGGAVPCFLQRRAGLPGDPRLDVDGDRAVRGVFPVALHKTGLRLRRI